MRDIFTELYKKVLSFFQAEEKETDASKNVACNRLKLVLMQDRTNLTPFLLEKMRGEMIQVLSKYVEMDQDALELNFEQEGEQMALMLSIPVLRAKEEDEIKAILEAEEADCEQRLKDETTLSSETPFNASNQVAAEEETEQAEETEQTDEDIEESVDEEVCEVSEGNPESDEISESPDEMEEVEEESSSKKSKKK